MHADHFARRIKLLRYHTYYILAPSKSSKSNHQEWKSPFSPSWACPLSIFPRQSKNQTCNVPAPTNYTAANKSKIMENLLLPRQRFAHRTIVIWTFNATTITTTATAITTIIRMWREYWTIAMVTAGIGGISRRIVGQSRVVDGIARLVTNYIDFHCFQSVRSVISHMSCASLSLSLIITIMIFIYIAIKQVGLERQT